MNFVYLLPGFAAGVAIIYFWLNNRFTARSSKEQSELQNQIQSLKAESKFMQEKNLQQEKQLNEKNAELKETGNRYLETHSINSSLLATKSQLEEQILFQQNSLADLNSRILTKNDETLKLYTEIATYKAELKTMTEKLSLQKEQVEEIQSAFYAKFQQLATEILDSKSKKFTELNQTNLTEILKPLQEKIREFESRVENTHLEETKQRSALGQEIRSLVELNNKISREANNLANALKTNVKAMGNWGELILESILENSGLEKDREYRVQPSYTNEEGQLRQPDIVIYFPDSRCVIIDSKVSLSAYERYVSADNAEEQDTQIKAHLLSMKQHIDGLSAKNYPSLYQLQDFSLDFVLMFMPVEPAYLLAMQKDSTLWNYAYQKKIILISPTNLIAILKMISSLWKQEYQNRNVQEIARLSGAMFDKFCGFIKDLETIGNSLESAQKNYDQALGKLSTGKGNLVTTAEKIRKLGAKTSKSLPKTWETPMNAPFAHGYEKDMGASLTIGSDKDANGTK